MASGAAIASSAVVGVPSTDGPLSPAVPIAQRPDVLVDTPADGEPVVFVDLIPNAGVAVTVGPNDDTIVYGGGMAPNLRSSDDDDDDDEGNDEEGDPSEDADMNCDEDEVEGEGSKEGVRLSAGLLMPSSPVPGHPLPAPQHQSSPSSDASLPSQVFVPSVNSSTGSTPECPIMIDATSQGSPSPSPPTPGGDFTRLVIFLVVCCFC